MQKSIAYSVCLCGLMTAFAVLFQSSPVFLPVIGMALSPISTLPAALATIQSKTLGLVSFIAADIILLAIYPQEACIFLFTTGIIGVSIGIHYSSSALRSLWVTAIILFFGMYALIYLFGISIFGDITPNSFSESALVFIVFSCGYSLLWIFIIKYFAKLLIRLKLLRPETTVSK